MSLIDNSPKTAKSPVPRSAVIFLLIVLSLAASSLAVSPLDYDLTKLHLFITFWMSILIQSFPFLLAGTLISSIIHQFVPESFISRTMAGSGTKSIPSALFASLLFPVCDCVSVPIASRLMKKGASLSAVVTYMLAAPILNPVVVISTYFAFPDYKPVFYGRIIMGILIPVTVGLFVGRVFRSRDVTAASRDAHHHHHGECCSCADTHDTHSDHAKKTLRERILSTLTHTGEEFVHVSPYIIAGAAVSSLVQAAVPKDAMLMTGDASRFFIQPAILICAAFILSVCSTSDAFIARGFSLSFSYGSVLGFMVAGPMIDVKNVLMMLPYFRKRFIVVLSLSVIALTYLCVLAASFLFFGAN